MAPIASGLNHNGITSGLLDGGDITPEKLAIMKLHAAEYDRDGLSEPDTPSPATGRSHKALLRSAGGTRTFSGGSRALTSRSTRHVSSSSRKTSSFMAGHRSKMSQDLTNQAESKFFALMELMTSASKEASTLKEYWTALMADRESSSREREEMLLQIEDISEDLENKDDYHNHQHRELGERRKEIERLVIELSNAMAATAEQKKKVSAREVDLTLSRKEFAGLQGSFDSLQLHHDKLKSDLEGTQGQLHDCVVERDSARAEAERHRSEYRTLAREISELKSRNNDLSFHLDAARKEVTSLTERSRTWERERADHFYEKDRLQEELRRTTTQSEEAARELREITDRYEQLQRELYKTKETNRSVELERDEHVNTIERLRHENKDKTTRLGETEARHAEITLRLEQSKREVLDKNEKLSAVESEVQTLRSQLDGKHEEYRLIIIERDSIKDDLESERRNVLESARHVTTLQDAVKRHETTITEVRSEILTLGERIRETERERDSARQRHSPLEKEIVDLKEKLALAHAEIEIVIGARDHARKELSDFKDQYEEVSETITEWKDDSEELQYEIESLRSMLREAREQKERAISARNSADRERDECVARYEEKCRQMERLEESKSSSSHFRSWGKGEGRSSSKRVISKSSTNNHSHSHGEVKQSED